MSGQFADLKPGSDARLAYWRERKPEIKSLLDEINNDVFNGKGYFGSPHYSSDYNREPPLSEPYLCLIIGNIGSIAVCTITAQALGVLVEDEGWTNRWKLFTCPPLELVTALKAAIIFMQS